MFNAEKFLAKCESPLERNFALAVVDAHDRITELGFVLETQYEVAPYRLDFAFLAVDGRKVCVEIDGHEFHEKTAEQAGYDKKRDRFLILNGWRVVRFTGREIYNDLKVSVAETLLHLAQTSPPTVAQGTLATAVARALIRLTLVTEEKARKRDERLEAQRKQNSIDADRAANRLADSVNDRHAKKGI